jgi:hypothetical protein
MSSTPYLSSISLSKSSRAATGVEVVGKISVLAKNQPLFDEGFSWVAPNTSFYALNVESALLLIVYCVPMHSVDAFILFCFHRIKRRPRALNRHAARR